MRGIHDYLCQTLYYDTAAYESYQQTGDYRIFCSAGAILPGTVGSGVVCEGYAKGFKVLCDQLGIPCVLIGGTVVQNNVREGHMWNGVQIGGRWYLVDATWDDKVDTISYQYFLAGDTFGNRVSSGNFGGSDPGGSTIFTYPYLETQGISYCDTVAHIYEAVETAAPACTTEGYTLYQCSACGASYKETVPALSHDYQVQSTVAATCTAGGYTVYACSRCGTPIREMPFRPWDMIIGCRALRLPPVRRGAIRYMPAAGAQTPIQEIPSRPWVTTTYRPRTAPPALRRES